LEERCDTLIEDGTETNSKVAMDGSIIEYRAKDHGFSQPEGVSHDDTLVEDHEFSHTKEVEHDVTLALGFSQDERFDLVHVGLVARGFEVHERDSCSQDDDDLAWIVSYTTSFVFHDQGFDVYGYLSL
jgi:hypothetical protein